MISGLLQAQDAIEKGSFTLHMLQHAIGEERYEVTRSANGGMTMKVSSEYSDRGTKRPLTAVLSMRPDLRPERLEVTGPRPGSVVASGAAPRKYFVSLGPMPFCVQMMMVRYWTSHGKPARLSILREGGSGDDAVIEHAGRDIVTAAGKTKRLERFTIANIVFGREVLWLDAQGRLAALMTFAGGLPMEAVRSEYEPAFAELFRRGVAQEMKSLEALGRQVPSEQTGAFAIAGASLVDGTNRPPIPDSVVIVRDGRIVAAGSRGAVAIPKGMSTVNAGGKTMLPGLWEMHTHYSGVEFGPPLLAAGITTARDCGGEFEFLVAVRDAIEKHRGLGPRLLLAGLVDGSGPAAFGAVTADTPEQARAVVTRYHAAGFQQIKLYTLLKPDVVGALAAEAHRMGMSVTGHVPSAMNAMEGVEAGMDQINHLNYVSQTMRPAGGRGSIDAGSEQARTAIAFFRDHHTVIDPTSSWGEMAGHPKDVEVSSFEPGILHAPYTLASRFRAMGSTAANNSESQRNSVIGALHRAGVAIVPGSDTGLLGYGLYRELELYVRAGMTPMEAIQAATIVSARAMKLDGESGTIEVGKRADLILVDGNPAENISDLRKVSRVVANGRMYDARKLWISAGFRP